MFHIYVKHPDCDDLDDRGMINSYNDLLLVLKSNEVKAIQEQGAAKELKHAINVEFKKPCKYTFLSTIKDITIDCLTNGYETKYLVFYF